MPFLLVSCGLVIDLPTQVETVDSLDASSDLVLADTPPDRVGSDARDEPDVAREPEASCLADTMVDPRHCGRCWHDCLGGQCSRGVCQAYHLDSLDTPVHHLAVYKNHLYATASGHVNAVLRYRGDGTQREVLVDGSRGADLPSGLVIDASGVYVANQRGKNVFHCSDLSCSSTPTELAKGLTYPTYMAVSGDSLFILDAGGNQIVRVSKKTPGSVEKLANADTWNQYIEGPHIAADSRHVYWTEPFGEFGARVWRVDWQGVKEKILVSSAIDRPTDLSIYGTDLLVSTLGGQLLRVTGQGGALRTLATSAQDMRDFTYDDSRLYWLESGPGPDYLDGRVMSCELPDCIRPVVLASPVERPTAISVDALALYYATFWGKIYAIAKP